MPQNPYLDIDQKMLGEIYSTTEPWDNLLVLCDDYDSRFGGTENGRKAAEFILEKFQAYGLKDARLEEYDYQGWERGPASLTMLSPNSWEVPCISLPYCHPAEVEGHLVFVNDGTPEDFEKAKEKIPGSITMATTHSPSGHRWMHRSEKYDRAILYGAKGFIWMQHVEGSGAETGSIGWNHDALIPGIGVAKEYGERLVRIAERKGEVRLKIKTTDRLFPTKTWNITGVVGGNKVSDETIVLGCHYDAHDISQGAQDPASGTVVVMEIGRVMAKVAAAHLDRPVRLVIYSNEEMGLFGSYEDVRFHKNEVPKMRFMLNLDSAGGGRRKGVILNKWPELEEFFRDAMKEMAVPVIVGESVSAFSDHLPYFLEGVPSANLGDPEAQSTGRGWGHTHWDTVDKVHLPNIRDAVSVVTRLALRVSNAQNWPAKRRDPESIKSMLDTEPNFDQHRLTEQLIQKYGKQILEWRTAKK